MRTRTLSAWLLPLLALSCRGEKAAAPLQVTGNVFYRERIALAPEAVIRATLEDVSRADAPAELLGQVTLPAEGRQVPIPFAISYDPAKVQEAHTYAVRVTITEPDGTMLWTSTRSYPVLTRGAGTEVEVMVERVWPDVGGLAGAWTVTGYGGGKGKVVPVLDGTELMLEFTEDTVAGSAGCNMFRGACEVVGDSLRVGALAATRKMCAAPEGIMEQEALFHDALVAAAAWKIEGGGLELRRGNGDVAVTARRRKE